MDSADLPLVVPLSSVVESVFGDMVKEYGKMSEGLKQQDREALAAAQAAAAPPPVETHVEEPTQKKGPSKKKAVPAIAIQNPAAADPAAGTGAADAAESPEKPKPVVVVQLPPPDSFRQRAEAIATKEKEFLTSLEKPKAWMDSRSAYLNAKPAEQYMIEDILGMWVEPVDVPDACIDIIAMAQEHKAHLEATYGYKAPLGLHLIGKERPVSEGNERLLGKLASHSGGDDSVAQNKVFIERADDIAHTPSPPPAKDAAARSRVVRLGDSESSPQDSAAAWLRRGSVSKKKLPTVFVEVSQQSLHFPDCIPGVVVEQRITLWNRDCNGRRFRIDPPKSTQIEVVALTDKYDSNRPTVPGQPIEFAVRYTPLSANEFASTVCIGHARDLNSTNAADSELSLWTTLEIPVTATCLTPRLVLSDELDVGASFAFASTTIHREVRNVGCSGRFRLTAPFPFVVEPREFVLAQGATTVISIGFIPDESKKYESSLTVKAVIEADEAWQGPVSEVNFPLRGLGVVADVIIEAVGESQLSGARSSAPLYYVHDACVGYTSQRPVVLRNNAALPVSVGWEVECRGDAELSMNPTTAVIPAQSSLVFSFEIQPKSFEPVEALCSLMLHNLPVPPVAYAAGQNKSKATVPTLGAGNSDAAVCSPDSITDPFSIFESTPTKPHKAPENENSKPQQQQGAALTFCGAFRIAADPEEPHAHLSPDVVNDAVPSLIFQAVTREIMLVNTCAKELPFWFDPPEGDDYPGADLDPQSSHRRDKKLRKLKEACGVSYKQPLAKVREDVDVSFNPQKGSVLGNTSLLVAVTYTLKRTGCFDLDIECFMADLAPKNRPHLLLHTEGRGPVIHVSSDCVDFGIIPFGGEAESRITITNNNPIPVEVSITDEGDSLIPAPPTDDATKPAADLQHRFVFLPRAASLKPHQEVAVTLYYRGFVVGEVEDTVRVNVVSGKGKDIHFHALIQKPQAAIMPPVLNFGTVSCSTPSVRTAMLANLSSVDLQYEIIPLEVVDGLNLRVAQPSGWLHAGARDVPMSIEATFSGRYPRTALLALRSPQLSEIVPFEVTCEVVEQLSVSIAPSIGSTPLKLSVYEFVEQMMEQIVRRVGTDPSEPAKDELGFCSSLHLPSTVMSTQEPFAVTDLELLLHNCSGTATSFVVAPETYVPALPPHAVLEATMSTAKPTTGVPQGTTTAQQLTATRGTAKTTLTTARAGTKGSHAAVTATTISIGTTTARRKLALSTTMKDCPTFQCKMRDGRDKEEADAAKKLELAQKLLLDGKGCAVLIQNGVGPIGGHEKQRVKADVYCNLPGSYHDRVVVSCDTLAPTSLDLSFTVIGKPLLIDPYTSGLTTNPSSGILTLSLPTVVGGISTITRKLKLVNRAPRDLDVLLSIMQSSTRNAFSVTIDGAVVPYCPDQEEGRAAVPSATISPPQLQLKSLETAVVTLEYAPPPNASAEWRATLLFHSRIALTPYNDRFLVDEFYQAHEECRPFTRALAAEALVENNSHDVRGVPKLFVRPPMIDRSNVVKDSVLLGAVDAPMALKAQSAEADSDDEVSAEHRDEAYEKRMVAKRIQLEQEAKERQQLRDYINRRHEELLAQSKKCFIPLEVDVVAHHVAAKLVCDPADTLRFASCRVGEECSRTVALKNTSTTPLDFRLTISPPFTILGTSLSLHDLNAVESPLIGSATTFVGASSTSMASRLPKHPDSDPLNTLFQLKPLDSVTVTVKFSSEEKSQQEITGKLSIIYTNQTVQDIALVASVHVPSVVCDPPSTTFRPPIITETCRPQPSYERVVYIINHSACAAKFSIVHKPADRPVSRSSETTTRLQAMQRTLGIHSLAPQVVDDPTRFVLSPMSGIAPAASKGGAPSRTPISIRFHELGTTHFECSYTISVEDGIGCDLTIRGESKQPEL